MVDMQFDFRGLGELPKVYREAQMQRARQESPLLAPYGGDMALANLALAQQRDARDFALRERMASPEYHGQLKEAEAVVANKYAPKTANFKLPGGEELTLEKGPGGYAVPQIKGMPAPDSEAAPLPAGVNPAEYRKVLARESAEIWAKKPMAEAAVADAVANLDRLKSSAEELKANPYLGRITGIPGALPNIPGGGGADAQAKLETMKSQVGFAVLQAMREASKTGGALGQVSEKENVYLQQNLAALQNSQSETEFRKNLDKIIEYTEGSKSRIKSAYENTYAPFKKPQQQSTWKNKETITAARANPQAAIAEAQQAIQQGADPKAVALRLQQIGIDPSPLTGNTGFAGPLARQ